MCTQESQLALQLADAVAARRASDTPPARAVQTDARQRLAHIGAADAVALVQDDAVPVDGAQRWEQACGVDLGRVFAEVSAQRLVRGDDQVKVLSQLARVLLPTLAVVHVDTQTALARQLGLCFRNPLPDEADCAHHQRGGRRVHARCQLSLGGSSLRGRLWGGQDKCERTDRLAEAHIETEEAAARLRRLRQAKAVLHAIVPHSRAISQLAIRPEQLAHGSSLVVHAEMQRLLLVRPQSDTQPRWLSSLGQLAGHAGLQQAGQCAELMNTLLAFARDDLQQKLVSAECGAAVAPQAVEDVYAAMHAVVAVLFRGGEQVVAWWGGYHHWRSVERHYWLSRTAAEEADAQDAGGRAWRVGHNALRVPEHRRVLVPVGWLKAAQDGGVARWWNERPLHSRRLLQLTPQVLRIADAPLPVLGVLQCAIIAIAVSKRAGRKREVCERLRVEHLLHAALGPGGCNEHSTQGRASRSSTHRMREKQLAATQQPDSIVFRLCGTAAQLIIFIVLALHCCGPVVFVVTRGVEARAIAPSVPVLVYIHTDIVVALVAVHMRRGAGVDPAFSVIRVRVGVVGAARRAARQQRLLILLAIHQGERQRVSHAALHRILKLLAARVWVDVSRNGHHERHAEDAALHQRNHAMVFATTLALLPRVTATQPHDSEALRSRHHRRGEDTHVNRKAGEDEVPRTRFTPSKLLLQDFAARAVLHRDTRARGLAAHEASQPLSGGPHKVWRVPLGKRNA